MKEVSSQEEGPSNMHIDENGQIADWDIKKVNRYIDGEWR